MRILIRHPSFFRLLVMDADSSLKGTNISHVLIEKFSLLSSLRRNLLNAIPPFAIFGPRQQRYLALSSYGWSSLSRLLLIILSRCKFNSLVVHMLEMLLSPRHDRGSCNIRFEIYFIARNHTDVEVKFKDNLSFDTIITIANNCVRSTII